MKNRTDRPIGKCKGCCLNFKTYCKAGFSPRRQWDRGRCRHYNDAALLEEILHRPEPTGARLAKANRRRRAELAATEPHHDGVLDPGKLAGRLKRHGRSGSP